MPDPLPTKIISGDRRTTSSIEYLGYWIPASSAMLITPSRLMASLIAVPGPATNNGSGQIIKSTFFLTPSLRALKLFRAFSISDARALKLFSSSRALPISLMPSGS